jgi:hypothetical protein
LKNMPCLLPLIIEPVANLHFVYSLKMNCFQGSQRPWVVDFDCYST